MLCVIRSNSSRVQRCQMLLVRFFLTEMRFHLFRIQVDVLALEMSTSSFTESRELLTLFTQGFWCEM